MQRALLIGSQTYGLLGVHHDLDLMEGTLSRLGFSCTCLTDADATREGMLAGLRELIATTTSDDAALIYYSGHGGLVTNPNHRAPTRDGSPRNNAALEPRFYQYIVPTDHTRQSFRGVLSAELAAILAELSAKTANVTSILDCCHSGSMLRGEYRPKALSDKPWLFKIDKHIQWLREQGYDLSARAAYVEGNPNAIRLTACMSSESAYEHTDGSGLSGGVMTKALVEVLREILDTDGPLPTWDAIGSRVKGLVKLKFSAQNPSLAGPIGRRWLSTKSIQHTDIFTYLQTSGGEHRLKAGSLQGIRSGDRFLVMPLNAGRADRALALAEAVATVVSGHISHLRLSCLPGKTAPPSGARAFRHEVERTRLPVRLLAEVPGFREAIAVSPRLMLAADNHAPTDDLLASIVPSSVQNTVEIVDDQSRLVRLVPLPSQATEAANSGDQGSAPSIKTIVATLDQLARVQELLGLRSGQKQAELPSPPEVQWGQVVDGQTRSLPLSGALLSPRDTIYVRVTNKRRTPLYITILGVGISRSIHVLTRSQPEGIELRPSEHYTLGADEPTGQVFGIPLVWPAELPPREAQPMALVIVASDMACDLRSLESDIVAVHDLLEQAPAVVRDFGDIPPPRIRHLRYAVRKIHFSVRAPAIDA